jgi:DNA-binding response OmpR family regulator
MCRSANIRRIPFMSLLIVEDEHLILDFVCAEITDAGLEAVGATSADEALRLLESTTGITALVTDINMPGSMDGLQLAAEVRKRWPSINIVITSGRRQPSIFEMPRGAAFVPKPFFPRQIIDAAQQQLR